MTRAFRAAHYLTAGEPDSDEGFYDNNPQDPGAETVLGLTREAEPASGIWSIVDRYKKLPGFPENMRHDQALQAAAMSTYEGRYWASLGLDRIDSILLQVKLFNSGVNIGTGTVRTYLTLCLNSYNKKATLWPDLPFNAGLAEIASAVNAMCAEKGGEDLLYDSLNSWQDVYYHIGKKAFAALMETVKELGPRDWSETFEWGWHDKRCLDAAQLRVKIAGALQALGI